MIYFILFIYEIIDVILCVNIVLPFKQLLVNSETKEYYYNSTLFIEDYLNYISYSLINIGEPKQQMILLFNQNNNEILVHKNNPNCKYLSENYNYLPELSKSVNILKYSSFNLSNYNAKQYLLEEKIELYTNKNYTKKIQINLVFNYLEEYNNISNNFCADFGFPLNKYLNKITSMTFIQQLKEQKIIDNYLITIEFKSNYEGFYHIGDFPHEFDKNNFKEYQLISTYSIPKNYLFQFQLSMNNIYILNNNKSEFQLNPNKIYFNLELGVILGPKEFIIKINELFFNKYFENNICKNEIIRKNLYDPKFSTIMPKNYYVISCEKNKKVDNIFFDIKSFPSLNFYHKEMNFTFSLSYNELFEEKNNIYYFLIVDILSSDDEWQIGIPFFRKYQTTFNIDTRKIYFYNKNIMLIKTNKTNNNNKLILICFGLSLVLAVITFILGKKINEQRKLRKNEIEDNNYNYISIGYKIEPKNEQEIEMKIKK